MPSPQERLAAVLADRYRIERVLSPDGALVAAQVGDSFHVYPVAGHYAYVQIRYTSSLFIVDGAR